MNHTDLEYGKVLVTGEIAFYMQHPKGRIITSAAKSKFINKWIRDRIKKKRDKPDVRKMLQLVRSRNVPSEIWDRNANSYLTHVENCKRIRELGKKDRELIDEVVAEMKQLGFHARTGVEPTDEITDDEAARFSERGAFLMMGILENRFQYGTLRQGSHIEFIATNQTVIKAATDLLLRKSFPLKSSDRHDILCVGSAEGQINTTMSSIL